MTKKTMRDAEKVDWVGTFEKYTLNGLEEGYPPCCIGYFHYLMATLTMEGKPLPSVKSKVDGRILCPMCQWREDV